MQKQIDPGTNEVMCQTWEESEKGWGTRPDGFSLHVTMSGLKEYITAYWQQMPNEAPDEYSRPSGAPYRTGAADSILCLLEENGGSQRYWSNYQTPRRK